MPELVVRIVGDTSSLEQSYKRAQTATGKFGKQMESAGRGATVASIGFRGLGRSVAFASGTFIGAAGLTAAMKTSIAAASNLNEQMSKSNVVFGRSAAEVENWSERSARSLGLAQDQALATASSFGALFRPLGLVGPEAAQQSEQLTQLGADLASFYNTDVQQALDAVRSGLVGESEPLRQYGILLSETRVQAEALRETHKTSVKELTNLEKVQARINIIQKDSATAQGDLARTAGSYANQTRTLKANLRDLAATVGRPLIFLAGNTAQGFNIELGWLNRIGDAQKKVQLSTNELRVVVPRLAGEYERLRARGVSVADAHKQLVAEFADSKRGADLLGAALDYIGNPEMRARVAKLQTGIEGVGAAAEEAAAKATSMMALAAQARLAARPRGEAAIGPGARLGLALARARLTPTTQDDLRVLVEQRGLYAKQIRSLQNRLSEATGAKARDLADQLQKVLGDDQSALSEITSIHEAAASRAAAQAKKIADAARKRAEANKRIAKANAEAARKSAQAATARRFGWLDFAVERAEATTGTRDDLRAYRALEAALKDRIRREGRTLDLARDLWRVRQQIADVNKSGAQSMFHQVSAAKVAGILGLGGDRRAIAVLSALGKGGTLPGGTAAFRGQAGTIIHGDVHVHGVQNPGEFEELMWKRQRSRAATRRGAR